MFLELRPRGASMPGRAGLLAAPALRTGRLLPLAFLPVQRLGQHRPAGTKVRHLGLQLLDACRHPGPLLRLRPCLPRQSGVLAVPRRDAFLRLKAALLRRSDTTMAPGFGGHPFASSNSCSRSTSACNDSASRAVRRTAFTSSRAFASLARAALNKPRYVPASQRASSSARRLRCASASATAARASASSARPRSYRSCPPASSAAASGNDQLPSPSCTRVSPTPTSPIAMPATTAQCRLSYQPQSPDDGTLTSTPPDRWRDFPARTRLSPMRTPQPAVVAGTRRSGSVGPKWLGNGVNWRAFAAASTAYGGSRDQGRRDASP